jgi:hypothetical protein
MLIIVGFDNNKIEYYLANINRITIINFELLCYIIIQNRHIKRGPKANYDIFRKINYTKRIKIP